MRNVFFPVWRLIVAYALMMAGASLMVLIAGIIGTEFAPTAALATLPIALVVVGVSSSTLPTGRLFHRFGRRPVFIAYCLLAVGAALLAVLSLVADRFVLFCLAALLIGWSSAVAGFLLNNEMGDFNARPGVSLEDGTIGTEANLIRPEQRMLSSMSPTIFAKDGVPIFATGTPGGRSIINTTMQSSDPSGGYRKVSRSL